MNFYDALKVADALPYGALIKALDRAFRARVTVPPRSHHTLPQPNGTDASLLVMPAWRDGGAVAVKVVSVFPDNARRNRGAVNAVVLLLDGETGEPRAIIDGEELTLRRTAAASALASRYLSRHDAQSMLMVGTGTLAPHMVRAHATVRPLKQILIWGRSPEKAAALAASLANEFDHVEAVQDLAAAAAGADIMSCATLAAEPLLRGRWLRPGQHVDLVGAFTPEMRETDGEVLQRARVFVDTYAGALSEAGDVLRAIDEGRLAAGDLQGDLAELAAGTRPARRSPREITLFKSVGTALEDLAAAELVVGGESAAAPGEPS